MTAESEPSAESLARLTPAQRKLYELRKAKRAAIELGVRPRDHGGPAPLCVDQERLWFVDQIAPGLPVYNINMGYELVGGLDVLLLERSLRAVIRRHGALRTVFRDSPEGPRQIVREEIDVSLSVTDLVRLIDSAGPATASETLQRCLDELVHLPFDLRSGPLVRAALIERDRGAWTLVLTAHHIVFDWVSGALLGRELSAFYAAAMAGVAPDLPPLPIQYADYAAWQRGYLEGRTLERLSTYWCAALEGIPSGLELPTDRPRPPTQTFAGELRFFSLPLPLMRELRALARSEGVSDFMLFLTALGILYHRYSSQPSVVIGTPISSRQRSETEPVIGYLLNMLAMRVDLGGDPTLRQALARVKRMALGAYAHQDMPFGKVVEAVRARRDLSRTPLFQATLLYVNPHACPLTLPGLDVRELQLAHRGARFDLTFAVFDRPDDVTGFVEFNSDLWDGATVERMLAHLENLLRAIVAGPDQRVSQLNLLSAEERRRLIVDWNATEAELPRGPGLHELFEEQVQRTPDALALVVDGECLTYAELNRRANRYAHRLRRLGVCPEVRVGVLGARSADWVVGPLAVLKAGGAYVPLDPALPRERLSYLCEDASVFALLARREWIEELPFDASRVLALDDDRAPGAEGDRENPRTGATDENLAYVLYTSGSTGRPKGVCCRHRGVVNLLADFQDRRAIGPGDCASLWTDLSFDVSVYEEFSALTTGATLHIVPDEVRSEASSLFAWLCAHQIRSAYLPAFLLEDLLALILRDPARFGLWRLLVGVEPIPEELLLALRRALPELEVINGYGPTEATICASLYSVANRDGAASGRTPIGRPVRNTKLYLLDPHRNAVPQGVPGEIHVAGPGLARCYARSPAGTAERFVPDPFGPEGGARLYRTGDRARLLADGNLLFLGRHDRQVKLRGFRIELGDVEAALTRHPGVRDALVLVRGESAEERLVAYFVPSQGCGGRAPERRELRSFLALHLPAYMVPSAFIELDEWPLGRNGKIDHHSLPVPASRPELDTTHVAPETAMEQAVASIWSELLGVESVGLSDNFFELGGHSILATQVVTRIRDKLGLVLPLRSVFDAPTLSGFALRLAGTRQAGDPGDGEPGPRPRSVVLPTTPARVDEYTDEEVTALLEDLLSGEAVDK